MKLIVDDAAAGLRLDAFVARGIGVSAAVARRLIAGGAVRVDRHRAVKGATLIKGATVEIEDDGGLGTVVVGDGGAATAIVYEDDHLVAIDKPAGMPSHPLRPGERGCAANGIVARFPECALASPDPREGGLAHRLDTATSGVLIAARSRGVWSALRRALGADDCEKRYLCQVWGAPADSGSIDVDIGRRGRRGASVRTGGGRQPRPAQTLWDVVARGKETALLEARLHAGRPHQVRAHMAASGFPIVGDDRYGGDHPPEQGARAHAHGSRSWHVREKPAGLGAPGGPAQDLADHPSGLRLHAVSVRLRHPVTGAPLLIVAPSPRWANGNAIR